MVQEETEVLLRQIADEAERELEERYKAPAGRRGWKRMARRMLGRDPGAWDPVSWPAGMLMLGLVEAGRTGAVMAYLDRWIRDGAIVRHVDDALTGYVLVRLWEESGEERYRKAADVVWQFLEAAPKTKSGAVIYHPERTGAVFADGIGQSVLFLAAYGHSCGVTEARDMAAAQLRDFRRHGLDRNTGLMYHGYEEGGLRQGIIGWGRAAGWLLMGWSVYLGCYAGRAVRAQADGTATDPEAGRTAELMSAWREMTQNIRRYQRKDGLFSWQLEAMEGPADTSAAGMIGWALQHAADAGVPGDWSLDAALDLADSLTKEVNGGKVYACSGECIDFGQYPQVYGSFPWGQGSVLAFLALAQLWNKGKADHRI